MNRIGMLSGVLLLLVCPLQSIAGEEPMIIEFGQGLSVVRQGGRVLIIDYENGQFCRLGGGCPGCTCVPLDPQEEDSVARQRIALFAEVERIDSSAGNGYVSLLFGSKALRMRSAAGTKLSRYGMIFSPERVDFLVKNPDRKQVELMVAAQLGSHYYKRHPLMSRLDLVGIFALLGGVPESMIRDGTTTKLIFHIRKEQNLRREWLEKCWEGIRHPDEKSG